MEIQHYAREPISLDQPVGDEGDSLLGEFIEDSQAVDAIDAVSDHLLQDHLQCVLATLSEREAHIVRLRFGFTDGQPRTLDEIGEIHGDSRTHPTNRNQNDGQASLPSLLENAARLPLLTDSCLRCCTRLFPPLDYTLAQIADVNGIRRTIIQTPENRKLGGSTPPLATHVKID